ncbi:MAG: hypothetical protein IJW40_06010 [Clostridia bacterium]|nr:hypothetical protein [Clostridia bacterium]
MTEQMIHEALCRVVREKDAACLEKMGALGKENATERGVLQMQRGIYNVCLQAGLCACMPDPAKTIHRRFPNFVCHFPQLAAYHATLSEEQKAILEVALYPEIWMSSGFLEMYQKERDAAKASGDQNLIFKAKMKYEVLHDVVSAWRGARAEMGLWAELKTEVTE